MVAFRISADTVPQMILSNSEKKSFVSDGTTSGLYHRSKKRRCWKNDRKTSAIWTVIRTVTSCHNFCYYLPTTIMTVSIIVALFAAPSALAFTQRLDRAEPILPSKPNVFKKESFNFNVIGKKLPSSIICQRKSSLLTKESTSYSRLFLSTQNPSAVDSNTNSDQQEWKAIFVALQLYKAAYGDIKIPIEFIVPAAAPWPELAWGSKLGQKVKLIREEELYVTRSPKRRKLLEKLGFDWEVSGDASKNKISFEEIFEALVVYRGEIKPSGPLTVPIDFCVPDADPWPENTRGLPLGKSLKQLRSKKFLKENPDAEKRLKQIGLETDKKLSANDKRFLAVYMALESYKEIYGDLLVPQPFIVPSDSIKWPEESWGLRLGARVNAIRSQGTFIKNNSERRDMLDALQFVWTPPEKESKKRGRKTLDQIDEEEKKAILEASVTSNRTIPSLSNISEQANLENDSEEEYTDSFLSFFDFNGNEQESSEIESSVGEPTWGLEADRENIPVKNNGDVMKIKVDDDYEAPRTLGDSLLAARERALEYGVIEDTDSKRPTKRKREPDIPWFNDDFGGYFVFEDVVEALTMYKKKYGEFSNLTNGEFVIPIKDAPEHSFDDDFRDNSNTLDSAETSNFDTIEDPSLTEDQIEAEISKLERGILSPIGKDGTTLVGLEQIEWPEHLEGMRLGDIVKRMKDGSLEVKHLPERKAQLDAIGFDWGDSKYFLDVPFEKAMCAMYAFYMVRGDMFVPPDYVMLDEDPWPRVLAGYELGKAVKRIRELQHFFEAFHTEKVSLLRMVDFVWFPTLAHPIDPSEPEMSSEMLLLGALGHPDYHQLDEFPMGLPDKIMADGPFHVSNDPRQWWREWHNWDYVADIWHSMGTKDRAVALRKGGYPRMADEHREKYGPGLFDQIDDYLKNILQEVGEEGLEEMIGPDDAKVFYQAVDQFDQLIIKWPGMTQSERMDAPGLYLTNFTLYGRKGGLPAILKVYTESFEDNQRQRTDLSENLLVIRDQLFNYLDELVDCTDMDDFELDILWRFRLKFYLSLPLHDRFDTSNKKSMLQESLESEKKEIGEMADQLESQRISMEDENVGKDGEADDESFYEEEFETDISVEEEVEI